MNIDFDKLILDFIDENRDTSSNQIFKSLHLNIGYSTFKRKLSQLVSKDLISTIGVGKATRYRTSPTYRILRPTDIDQYFRKEIDERIIGNTFNFELLDLLVSTSLFSHSELIELNFLQEKYQHNISNQEKSQKKIELERLAIDLSWKSSQIEGNTYSLLETEILIKEKIKAVGKTKEEAIMLLNHKEAIDFLIENPDYLFPLNVSKIVDIHRLLVKELDIDKQIRRFRVGISGTNYKPLDNEFQIIDALERACQIVNQKDNIFEKALLVLLLLSYIQPFTDGNKRTARIVANSILIHFGFCPISYRTVEPLDYKKAILVFYEQNNLYAFKNIFIEQYRFAVNTYF